MKRIILLFCCLYFALTIQAQQLVQERLYKVGNTGRGFTFSHLTREGNVAITGGGGQSPGVQSVIAIIKPNTDTLWMRNGPLISTGSGFKQTSSEGFIFYTTKRYISPAASGTILQKYDNNGQLKWTVPYQMNAFDSGYLLLTAPDSGYYLGGRNIINGKNSRFALSRTDSLGNLKWRKSFNWVSSDFLSDMQHTLNSNIIMYGITGGPQRLKLLLVNQNGDSVLGRQLSIIGNPNRAERIWSSGCGVTSLSDGGFLLAAEIDTSVANASPLLGMVVKVNANLQPVWHYINHSVPDNVIFTRSRELTDGSIVMLAFERKGPSSTPGNKFFLYRFSATGSLMNVYTFTSNIAIQVQANTFEYLAADSSFIIGGNGVVTAVPSFSGGFYVAKVKVPGLPPAIQLSPPIINGIKPELAASSFYLGQSYPNPTSVDPFIEYSLPKRFLKAQIIIREIATGREIRKYELKSPNGNLAIDVSQLQNGLYLYSLVVDDKPVATKKLAVMK